MIVSTFARRLIKQICQNLEEQIIKDLEYDLDEGVAGINEVRDTTRVIFESDAKAIWDIK